MIQKIKYINERIQDWWGHSGTRPWLFEKIETYYYNVKYTIINFYKYAGIVSKHRPWDGQYILDMMRFQLKELCNTIETCSDEVDESRLPKIEKMKRCIEILTDVVEGNYPNRCGYLDGAEKLVHNKETHSIKFERQKGYEDYDGFKVFDAAIKLEKKEWNELFEMLKDIKGWWD